MKFKFVEDFTNEVKKENTPNDSEQYFRKEIKDYRSIPYLEGQPLYLVCPQYTYEVELQTDKIEELLAEGTLKVKGIYEADFGISPPRKEALPNLEEGYEPISKSNPIILDIKKPQESDGNKLVIHLPNSTNQCTDLLPADTDGRLCEALYLLDGINAYRAEVPLYLLNDCLKKGAITQFPNSNSDLMFQKLKSKFQEHCRVNGLPYTSWINE